MTDLLPGEAACVHLHNPQSGEVRLGCRGNATGAEELSRPKTLLSEGNVLARSERAPAKAEHHLIRGWTGPAREVKKPRLKMWI